MMMSAIQAGRLFLQVIPTRTPLRAASRSVIGNKGKRPPALTGRPEESQNPC